MGSGLRRRRVPVAARRRNGSRDQDQEHLRAGEVDFFGSDPETIVDVWQRVLGLRIPVLAIFSEFDVRFDYFTHYVQPLLQRRILPRELYLSIFASCRQHPGKRKDFLAPDMKPEGQKGKCLISFSSVHARVLWQSS